MVVVSRLFYMALHLAFFVEKISRLSSLVSCLFYIGVPSERI